VKSVLPFSMMIRLCGVKENAERVCAARSFAVLDRSLDRALLPGRVLRWGLVTGRLGPRPIGENMN